jgi:ATP-dependent Zn protease
MLFIDDKEKHGGETQGAADQEIRQLLQDSYQRAKKLIETHRKELDIIAQGLQDYESLSG